MAQYDETILQKFADELYRQAAMVVWISALGWAGIAFLVVWLGLLGVASQPGHQLDAGLPVQLAFVAAFFAGLFGAASGSRKAFKLKLEAQRTLCQLQMERNTRSVKSTELVSA